MGKIVSMGAALFVFALGVHHTVTKLSSLQLQVFTLSIGPFDAFNCC
jgi:hypothetical protein